MYVGHKKITLTPDDVILGEMTCMNHYPRSATVTAGTDAEVLRINRNVLFMLQRNEVARKILDKVYRRRVLDNQLASIGMLKDLSGDERKECVAYLREVVELARVDPGQVIFRQGEAARDFFMVRLGFVKVSQSHAGQQRVLCYLGPGSHFGEIGILSALTDELEAKLPAIRPAGAPPPVRHSTMWNSSASRDITFENCGGGSREFATRSSNTRRIYSAKMNTTKSPSIHRCRSTWTKVCSTPKSCWCWTWKVAPAATSAPRRAPTPHDDVTRLIREGLRFDKWLVAGSCRSCLDPYCLWAAGGCDSPGGFDGNQNRNHCIGCGQCAQNCPYGNINMHGFPTRCPTPTIPTACRPSCSRKQPLATCAAT